MPSVETAPTPTPAKFAPLQMWAIVELMGHQRMAGEITEVTIAGHGFIRIDVPATSKAPAFTRMVSPSSIYAINPTTQDLVRRAAEAFQPRPVQEWELPRALPPSEGALKHLGTHNPDGTFTAAEGDGPLEPPCERCGQIPVEGEDSEGVQLCDDCLAALAEKSSNTPSHAECAVCRKSGDPLTNGPDGLPRCRACGCDGA